MTTSRTRLPSRKVVGQRENSHGCAKATISPRSAWRHIVEQSEVLQPVPVRHCILGQEPELCELRRQGFPDRGRSGMGLTSFDTIGRLLSQAICGQGHSTL